MDPTDESRRKPRRTRGTPSYYYRDRFAIGALIAATAIFAVWTLTPIYRTTTEKIIESLRHRTEEEIERRYLFGFAQARTSKQIQEQLKDSNEK